MALWDEIGSGGLHQPGLLQGLMALLQDRGMGLLQQPPMGSQPPPDAPGAGMLAGLGGEAKPPANDPAAMEPVIYKDGAAVRKGIEDRWPMADLPQPTDPAADPSAEAVSLAPPVAPTDTAPRAAVPATPGAAAPAPGGGGLSSLFGKIMNPDNALTLLALGSGFAGAPSLGTGMRRGFGAALPAAQADRAESVKQGGIAATYRALIDRKVPPAEALAAVYNPDVMKAVAAKYFETKPRTSVKLGTDMNGNDIMGSFDPNTGKHYDMAGRDLSVAGAGGAGTPGAFGAESVLAKGVKEYDPELPAEQYLAQFSPEVQASMKAYARGDTMPSSNPRAKTSSANIKKWATLWGDKAGVPVSDALFSERRKYRTELGSTSANSAGGSVKAFNQGIEHADSLATTLEKLGNKGLGGWFPDVAHGVNSVREKIGIQPSGFRAEAQRLGQTLAGEVGKLFSGAAGGGVHERDMTRKAFDTVSTPQEMAGALRGTLETMDGGLRALERRRDQILGPNSGVEFVDKGTLAKIERIKETIKRLEGDPTAAAAPGAPAAPAAVAPAPGAYVYDPSTHSIVPAR